MNPLANPLPHILTSLAAIWSEIWLATAFVLLLIADLVGRDRRAYWLPWLAGLAIVLNLGLLAGQVPTARPEPVYFGMLRPDAWALGLKWVFNLAGLVAIWLSAGQPSLFGGQADRTGTGRGEFYATLLAMLAGMQLLAMADHLLMAYVSLELVSVGAYVLVLFGFGRKPAEAGIKYVLFGVFASAVMLYGMSLLYGLTGQLALPGVLAQVGQVPSGPLLVALVLSLAGFLFKIAAAPFHLWAPDVYEAAPAPVVAFLATAPKAAGFAVLFRLAVGFADLPFFTEVLAAIALISIILGNLAALWQSSAKRLLAYSSVAQAGFVLAGVLAQSAGATFYYLLAYALGNFIAFGFIALAGRWTDSDQIDGFKGLGQVSPSLGVAVLVGMASLIGLPPTAGFMGKLLVFSALWERWQATGHWMLLALLVGGLLSTVVSVYYYLRIPFLMFFRPPAPDMRAPAFPLGHVGLLMGLAALVLGLFLATGQVLAWVR
jgi:NADH-quinone oxidoreductase subunit N